MTNLRTDVMYFGLILVVSLIAYYASTRSSIEPLEHLEIPALHANFEPPSVDLPEPYFVFRPLTAYQAPEMKRSRSADEMESALVGVRSALLTSSIPTEVHLAE